MRLKEDMTGKKRKPRSRLEDKVESFKPTYNVFLEQTRGRKINELDHEKEFILYPVKGTDMYEAGKKALKKHHKKHPTTKWRIAKVENI